MTGDEFTARYRLRKQLTDGDIVSYLASDDRDGNVLVHVYHGESAPAFDASLLDEPGGDAVREILDVEGIAVVVTEPIEPFSTFEAWVAEHQRSAEEEGPGAFTRIFRVQSPGEPSGLAAEPEAGPSADEEGGEESVSEGPEVDEPTGSGPSVEEPGEFTRAFGALRQPPPMPEPSALPPTESELPQVPVPPETETPAASVESVEEPSLGAAQPPEPTQPQATPSPAPPTQPPAERGTGTFTRIMGAAHGSPGSVVVPPPTGDAPSPTADGPPRRSQSAPGSAPAPPRPGGAPFPPARPDAPAAPRPGSAPPPPTRSTSHPPPRPGGPPPPRPSPGVPPPPRPGGAPPPPTRPSPPPPPAQGSGGTPPPPPPFPGSPRPASGQKAEPGPYTRAMRAHRDSGQPRSPSPPAGSGDASASGYGGSESYLDRLRGRTSPDDAVAPRQRTEESPPPAPPEMRTKAPPVPSGPSEYTRVIRGAEAASLGRSGSGHAPYGSPPTPTPPPVPAQPAASKTAPAPSRTPVVVMLVVTVVVLVAVVLFLALRTS